MNGEDRIRNEYMRGSIDLASIVKNMNNVSWDDLNMWWDKRN
jgi:hypothetical protein